MAFGITRIELQEWKKQVLQGEIAFLTHFWQDVRFPNCYTVTKVGCSDIEKLITWGKQYGLQAEWIHYDEDFPHFDLFGEKELEVLQNENKHEQIERFNLLKKQNTGR